MESLLIEAELIHVHQPQFNTLLKDDKTPLYLMITDDIFPKLIRVRKKELYGPVKRNSKVIGPFSSSYKLAEVMKIVRPIFPWCNHPPVTEVAATSSTKPCFYFHLELCPGACVGLISAEKYQQNIKQLQLFLRGKTHQVVSQLKQELKTKVEAEEFESAAIIKHQLDLIAEVTSPKYTLAPDLVLPGFQQSMIENGLIHLKRILINYLQLPAEYPLDRIECYDVSNNQGTNPTVSQVVFNDGHPQPKEYRLYNIRSLNTPNDFAMLQEALLRRQNHPEWTQPNLVLIDGGKGQINAVQKVWHWPVPIVGIAKDPDRLVIPIHESKFGKNQVDAQTNRSKKTWKIIPFPANHPIAHILTWLRDEAHRFAQLQHHRLQLKQMVS